MRSGDSEGPLATGTRHCTAGPGSAQSREKRRGYTTVLKVMQIMHEKGLLEPDESARTHPMQEQFVRLGPHGVKLEHIRGLGSLGPGPCHPSLSRESNPGGRQTASLADCWSRFRQKKQGKGHGLTAGWSLCDKKRVKNEWCEGETADRIVGATRRKLKKNRFGVQPRAFPLLSIGSSFLTRVSPDDEACDAEGDEQIEIPEKESNSPSQQRKRSADARAREHSRKRGGQPGSVKPVGKHSAAVEKHQCLPSSF